MFEYGTHIDRRAALHRLSLALGGIATVPLTSGLLAGCRTPADGELASYAYQTLGENQQRTLATLVDQIIPATDTPGASEVGVPQFIDKMLAEWYAPPDRDGFLAGLDAVDRRASGSFVGLSGEEQARLVATLDAEAFADQPGAVGSSARPDDEPVDGDVAGAAQEGTSQTQDERENEVAGMQGDLGESMEDREGSDDEPAELVTGEGSARVAAAEPPPFFRQLKELTLAGYYTSEAGATEELRWVASPGRYDADVPLSEVGRAWA